MTETIQNAAAAAKAGAKSKMTTIGAILAVVIAVASPLQAILDGDPTTIANWEPLLAAAPVAFGLFFARDGNVSSEESSGDK